MQNFDQRLRLLQRLKGDDKIDEILKKYSVWHLLILIIELHVMMPVTVIISFDVKINAIPSSYKD